MRRFRDFLIGHGTEMVRYEEILEFGKLVHNKDMGVIGGSYGPLRSLLYTDERTPHDEGNGLFVPDPELVKGNEIFVRTATGIEVELTSIKWIVLPPCEAEIARSTLNPNLARYGIQIATYRELADQLGYIQDLNVVTTVAKEVLNDFKTRYQTIETREDVLGAIRAAGQLLITASEKGSDGIMEAALIVH
jgi:hypothetical protein